MAFIGGVGATYSFNQMPLIGSLMQHMGNRVVRETSPKVTIDEQHHRPDLYLQLCTHQTIKRNELLFRDRVQHPEDKPLYDALLRSTLGGVFAGVVAAPFVMSLPQTAELSEAIQNVILFGGSAVVGLLGGFAPNIIQAVQAQGTIQALLQGEPKDVRVKRDRLKTLAALGYHESSGTRCMDPDEAFDRKKLNHSKLEAALFDFVLNANEATPKLEIINALDLLANHFKSAYTLFHLHQALRDNVGSPSFAIGLTAQAFMQALRVRPARYRTYIYSAVATRGRCDHLMEIRDIDLFTLVPDLPLKQQEEFKDFCSWVVQRRSDEEKNLMNIILSADRNAPSEEIEAAIGILANHFKSSQTIFQLYSRLRRSSERDPRICKMLARAYVQCLYADPGKYKAHLKRHGTYEQWDELYMFQNGSTYQMLAYDLGKEGKEDFKLFYERTYRMN